MKNFLILAAFAVLSSCQSDPNQRLKEALTFYASFDNGPDADFAKGDKRIYTARSQRAADSAEVGMLNPDHRIIENQGKFGHAFRFGAKSDTVVFYKSKNNIVHDATNWSGTVSFWLKVDPAKELAPGFTDPIQITDQRYDDAAIWVDFTGENPRTFRLGVLGDRVEWHKDTVSTSRREEYARRLVPVEELPFSSSAWTHIAITYNGLGSAQSIATLYLDGNNMGSIEGIDDPFNWELDKSNIFIGINFIGMMDELSIYNRPFSADEVMQLYGLEEGVKSLL
ncbi:MAG: LamG domain-containing protein [Bacteroidota bacterium]